jgi:hypothetical protein
MGIITEQPTGLDSGNDLDDIEIPSDTPTPAYLSFGTSPSPVEEPPEIDEVRTYIIRARCTGKTETERTDGEMRHGRKLQIQACWESGKKPPAADDAQPGLFDDTDEDADNADDRDGDG